MNDLTMPLWLLVLAFILGAGLTLTIFPRRTYVVYTPPSETNADSSGCLGVLIGLLLLAIVAMLYLGVQ